MVKTNKWLQIQRRKTTLEFRILIIRYTSVGCILTEVILTNRRYLDKKYRFVFLAQYRLYLDEKFSIWKIPHFFTGLIK